MKGLAVFGEMLDALISVAVGAVGAVPYSNLTSPPLLSASIARLSCHLAPTGVDGILFDVNTIAMIKGAETAETARSVPKLPPREPQRVGTLANFARRA